ncbi:hypothetical protein Y032_0062g3306 [Ancylostoma ceylanicum]|uniref:Uncharacterized protein n=1 Tax=Ancylostoma ceylanicum TaxID=53326 RepID=A0A016U235_9BILA|nr:hypothetical protein Y032_0062g3306 [Ancylostoma ceylanicum]
MRFDSCVTRERSGLSPTLTQPHRGVEARDVRNKKSDFRKSSMKNTVIRLSGMDRFILFCSLFLESRMSVVLSASAIGKQSFGVARSNTPLAGVDHMPERKDRLRLCTTSVQSLPKIDWRT